MRSYKIEKLIEINKLRFRLESLVKRASNIRDSTEQIGLTRYKPFYRTYNLCVREFESLYPEEYNKLDFEELPLYDAKGKERFTREKLSTLINQSEELISILKGSLYPYENYLKLPGNITISWLIQNANLKFVLKIITYSFLIFSLGIAFGKTNLYKNIESSFKAKKTAIIIKKPTNNNAKDTTDAINDEKKSSIK